MCVVPLLELSCGQGAGEAPQLAKLPQRIGNKIRQRDSSSRRDWSGRVMDLQETVVDERRGATLVCQ